MNTSTTDFKARVRVALNDRHLEQALGRARDGFVLKRRKAVDARPDFEALRDQGVAIRDHTLDHLEDYLDQFIQAFEAQGGQVHRAADAEEARRIVLDTCAQAGALHIPHPNPSPPWGEGLVTYLSSSGVPYHLDA